MRFMHDQLAEAGHHIEYFCSEDVAEWVRGRWGRLAFPWAVVARVRRAVREGAAFDVINVHEPSGALVALFRRFSPGAIVTVTSHGLEPRAWDVAKEESRLGREGPSLKTRISYPLVTLWQSALALRKADHVFCLSNDDRDYLLHRVYLPPARVTRIYPGASGAFAAVGRARDYTEPSRILFAASWRKNKGIEDLVPAFGALVARHSTLRLTVLGSGVPADQVINAFPGPVRANVDCVQARTEEETAQQFGATDLYLLPSVFEGTPLTLIEAMMSGLPIVTTETCGMKDVIANERNGLLVPIRRPDAIAGAINRLIGDKDLRARLGRAALHDALEHYTWPVVARAVADAYECLRRGLALSGNSGRT